MTLVYQNLSGKGKISIFLILVLILYSLCLTAQEIDSISLSNSHGLNAAAVVFSDGSAVQFSDSRPFFRFDFNNRSFTSAEAEALRSGQVYRQVFESKVSVTSTIGEQISKGWKCTLVFENISTDTISLSNVLPFSVENTTAYITGYGPWDLARAYLFRPGTQI